LRVHEANAILLIEMFSRTTTRRFRTSRLFLVVLGTLPVVHGQGSGSTTQGMTAGFNPAAQLAVGGTLTLLPGAAKFSPFQATLTINYQARTKIGGAITAQVTSNFSPPGGPSAAGNALQYSCGAATLGAPCSVTQNASTGAATTVLTLPATACTGGGGSCSPTDPNTVDLNFTLTDDPTYSTGFYTATVTFTISAT
jgi:hypothetical protein